MEQSTQFDIDSRWLNYLKAEETVEQVIRCRFPVVSEVEMMKNGNRNGVVASAEQEWIEYALDPAGHGAVLSP